MWFGTLFLNAKIWLLVWVAATKTAQPKGTSYCLDNGKSCQEPDKLWTAVLLMYVLYFFLLLSSRCSSLLPVNFFFYCFKIGWFLPQFKLQELCSWYFFLASVIALSLSGFLRSYLSSVTQAIKTNPAVWPQKGASHPMQNMWSDFFWDNPGPRTEQVKWNERPWDSHVILCFITSLACCAHFPLPSCSEKQWHEHEVTVTGSPNLLWNLESLWLSFNVSLSLKSWRSGGSQRCSAECYEFLIFLTRAADACRHMPSGLQTLLWSFLTNHWSNNTRHEIC